MPQPLPSFSLTFSFVLGKQLNLKFNYLGQDLFIQIQQAGRTPNSKQNKEILDFIKVWLLYGVGKSPTRLLNLWPSNGLWNIFMTTFLRKKKAAIRNWLSYRLHSLQDTWREYFVPSPLTQPTRWWANYTAKAKLKGPRWQKWNTYTNKSGLEVCGLASELELSWSERSQLSNGGYTILLRLHSACKQQEAPAKRNDSNRRIDSLYKLIIPLFLRRLCISSYMGVLGQVKLGVRWSSPFNMRYEITGLEYITIWWSVLMMKFLMLFY